MKALLADINIQGDIDRLMELLDSDPWDYFWSEPGIEYLHFKDVGLDQTSPDSLIWDLCQREEYVLITDNRNDDGPDSLATSIRTRNSPEAWPVLTVSNKNRLGTSQSYALKVMDSLFEVFLNIERFRGWGRVYLPLSQMQSSEA